MPDEHAVEIHRAARRCALALKAVYACDGISMRQHNEPAESQDVWHYHWHVTPRFVNDSFYLKIPERQLMPARERAQHALQLRAYLANHSAR